jgi:hypothetical protein
VGERVSPAPNDKQQLVATLAAVAPVAGPVTAVLADSGFYSEEAVQTIERTPAGDASGTIVYAAMEKISHHRSVADLEKKQDPAAPPPGAAVAEQMRHRLKTSAGRKLYSAVQQNASKRSNQSSASSRRRSASGSSCCAARPRSRRNGRCCAWPILLSSRTPAAHAQTRRKSARRGLNAAV